MSFLLDTNVISEWARPQWDEGVVAWFAEEDEDRIYMSVASFAEIRFGIERLPAGKRREQLAAWLADDLPNRFEGRILEIDHRVAEAWGVMMARGQRLGANVTAMDAFFAATADVHGLILVTRNVRDFAQLGIRLLNPWQP